MADPGSSDKLFATVGLANLMTPRQEEIVQRDIKVLERALHGQPMPYYGGDPVAGQYVPELGGPRQGTVLVMRDQPVPDREDLQKTLNACHETLRLGTAPELSAAAKNQLFARYKVEEARYKEGMPSYDQMWRPTWQNVQLHERHAQANKKRGKFLQNARRILEPSNDGFHIEELRPDKPTPYSQIAFGRGYDGVQWSTEKELELRAQELDDATYLQFLTLKAQGITTPRLVQQAMHIDQAMYEACMQRLQAARVEEGPEADEEAQGAPGEPEDAVALSEGQTTALQTYGDAVLALLEEQGARTPAEVAVFVEALTPEAFEGRKKLQSHVVARRVLKALRLLGHLEREEDADTYRLRAMAAGAAEE